MANTARGKITTCALDAKLSKLVTCVSFPSMLKPACEEMDKNLASFYSMWDPALSFIF